jgi:riboflavin synthase
VNLETALRTGDELGGHFVQGHVDGVVRLLEKAGGSDGNWLLRFENPDWLAPLIPRKASIAVDGISLTVQDSDDQGFAVAIIPSTYSSTNLHNISTGTGVNIEADMIVKAVVHALSNMDRVGRPLTEDKLRQMGYL